MKEERKMKRSTKYLLIGTLVLFLSVLGASMAYYLARISGNLSGRAAGTELELMITPLTSEEDDLIPLDSDVETLQLAALGYDNKGACIDINGYSVCQIYRIRVTNNGSVPLTVNGTVNLHGANTPNIDCAKMDDEDSITNNNSCMGENVLASNQVLPANNHLDYYVMVYIKNLDEPQYDKGEFNGTVTFTSIDGKKVKGRFKHEDTAAEYITNLYNNAEKTVVHHGTYILNNNSSSTSGVSNTDNKVNSMLLAAGHSRPETPGTPSTIDYHYATSVGLMNDRLGGTSEGLDIGNIRYYGAEPNNYINIGDRTVTDETKGNWEDYFPGMYSSTEDCLGDEKLANTWDSSLAKAVSGYETIEEFCSTTTTTPAGTPILWRIIGVFDGKVRIVRDNPIGEYSWDTSASDVNNGSGINEWSQADLMKLLNPGYETNTDSKCTYDMENDTFICETGLVNNSLWWNSGSGTCYSKPSKFETAPSCDFTNSGLSDGAKKYITDQTIYLGGFEFNDIAAFPNQAYIIERGNKIVQNPTDNVTRTLSWTGKVGLMYPSDYGYAADLNSCSESLFGYSNTNCTNNNWLYLDNKEQFMISPYVGDSTNVVKIVSSGVIRNDPAASSLSIHPVLTLSSDTYILEGTGTKANPYKITD